MAPGAIAVDLLPIAEGSSRDAMTTPAEHKLDGDSSGIRTNNVGDSSKLYTGAYTHGYTDGYFSAYAQAKQSPIAIVGMSCRLPGNVTTPDEFWELCSRARSGWSEIPKERFEMASFYHPNPGKNGCFNAIGGNFLKEDIGLFDAPFFSLTAQEATSMDPQQRLLLECTFEALDSAGIPKHKIVGQSVGVFIGGSFSEYESQLFADTETIPMHQATGCAFSMQSNRISHFFDLRGPSFTMDTACSSSLVALHQACQSVRNGESDIAIVGGCHLNMLPEFWVSMSKSRLFSDEGRSFSFDSRGTGYGRGEGCGIIILKSLENAMKSNDVIRSVILGSGINQDGKTPGITMPNGSAQESLIQSVYRSAGIDPKDTGYIEAHGTGTKVGDPIEARALFNVFGEGRSARSPLFLGSVKSNIGHLEAASGIVSVIKTALMLERGFILPNYDFKRPNEKIPFSKWNLKVPISQRPWPRPKRFASVNNFGFGGTNAHIVLERAPFFPETGSILVESAVQARKLYVLSANDKLALETMIKNLGIYLEQRPEVFQNDLMNNVAYTLGQRRSLMQWRIAIPSTSSLDLIEKLISGKISPAREIKPLRIGFVFTGQGAQWYAMGRELYDQYPVFASTIDRCDQCLTNWGVPYSLGVELRKDITTSLINEAHISQPACTAIQLALTDLLRAWGVSPTAVIGHSSGEIGAAYAAGILPLVSCMAISYQRGMAIVQLKRNFPNLSGAMIAVGGSEAEIQPLINQLGAKHASIACFNSPYSLSISGDKEAIDELQIVLEQKQIFNRRLQVDVAYHSHHMSFVSEHYRQSLQNLDSPKNTPIKLYSSLLGRQVEGTELKTSYWINNLTQAVRFSEAFTSMCRPTDDHKVGINMIVEIGPHSALAGPIKQILKACGSAALKIPYASALVRKKDAVETAFDLASILFVRGATLDLGAINHVVPSKPPMLLIDMPRYPWNHKTRYWHESRMMKKHKNRSIPRNDLLGTLANYSNDLEPIWRNILRLDNLPWLRHHKVQSLTLFPMSGYLSLAVEAASQRAASENWHYDEFALREISVTTPLMLTDEDIEITLQMRPQLQKNLVPSRNWDEFRIHSWTSTKGWTEHCKGLITVRVTSSRDSSDIQLADSTDALQRSVIGQSERNKLTFVEKTKIYDKLSELGVYYGATFQGMNDCYANDTCSLASITVVDTRLEMPHGYQSSWVVHPALLEQLIEIYWPILGAGRTSVDTIYLPSSIGRMTISRRISDLTKAPGDSLQAFCRASPIASSPRPFQISMCATTGNEAKCSVISLTDLTVSPVLERSNTSKREEFRELCYKLSWEPILQVSDTCIPYYVPDGSSVASSNEEQYCGINNQHLKTVPNGVSQNTRETTNLSLSRVAIIHGECESQYLLASNLADTLEKVTGTRPNTGTLMETVADGMLCLFILELESPMLSSITSAQFTALQKILGRVNEVLWVVRGAYANSSNPDANMITGFSRSIRSETSLKFATLDLDADSQLDYGDTIKAVLKVLQFAFGPYSETNCDLEFMERKNELFTPRIINDTELNEYIHKQTHAYFLEPTEFAHHGRPLKMVLGTTDSLESLYFVDQVFGEPLPEDEMEIEIKAIGLNSEDLFAIRRLAETQDLGVECSGVVTRIGKNCSNFVVGHHIAGISVAGGLLSSYARLKATFSFKINNDISFESAASMPVAYCKALYGLMNLAQLQKHDRILIYGADTAAGQAAICLAHMIGATIFATVSDVETAALITKFYDLHDNQVLSGHDFSCKQPMPGESEGKAFDVVFWCCSANAEQVQGVWDCLNNFGRFIEIEKQDANTRLDVACLKKNKSFMTVDLVSMATERPQTLMRLLLEVCKLLDESKIFPLRHTTTFPMSDAESALRLLQSGNAPGKLLISPQLKDVVQATRSKNRHTLLRSDASYILIGGTGGLGRSMARWMVGNGARHLILVSRNGSVTGKVKELVDELTITGASIAVRRCDVADSKAVQNLFLSELVGMPQVRGVIHGAMVLEDVLFERMTYEQYSTVIQSKVKGAWNFHKVLSANPLDFFVALTSAAGAVGNRGQAAYSAANTFLNAFIQYRLRLGLRASSIDLTAVSDVGHLAEDLDAAAKVARNLGSDTICETEVLALLEAAIDGHLARTCNDHTITGMRITQPPPFWVNDAKFKHLRYDAEAAAKEKSSGQPLTTSFNAALKAAGSLGEAQDVVCQGLSHILPSILMLEAGDMDVTKSLSNYALDSLVAIEVRNYIAREFEANLQVLELLSSGSIETLAKTICMKSKIVSFKY